jgi:hypothetical protein
MENDPQDNDDVTADDELLDEVLGGVSGGNPVNEITIPNSVTSVTSVGDLTVAVTIPSSVGSITG